MDVKLTQQSIQHTDADTIILSMFQEQPLDNGIKATDEALSGAISDLIAGGDFEGKSGQVAVLYSRGTIPARRIILVGLGKAEDLNIEGIRRAAAHAISRANTLKAVHVATILHGTKDDEATAQAITEASHLALYVIRTQKKDENSGQVPTIKTVELVADTADTESVQRGIDAGNAIAAGVAVARDLVNLPPNLCTPIHMAQTAENIAKEFGLKYEAFDEGQMREMKMGALLSVSQGSDTPPRFIVLEYNADRADELDTVVLVGKGVTFDTGGYSIKTSEGMISMKTDMAGGAAVVGAMRSIAELKPSLHVVGLVPAADNMISGNAFRPSEVVVASNGVSIEIISTDAEGRMLLADALVYASRYKPTAVVDIATLTGACVVALGGVTAGLFATDEHLADVLIKSGDTTNERVWRMPMYSEYGKGLESQVADTKNTGARMGGACAAAVFLKKFVDYSAWAHIDMAGMASDANDIPYAPKGATGYGVRLFTEFVRRWS